MPKEDENNNTPPNSNEGDPPNTGDPSSENERASLDTLPEETRNLVQALIQDALKPIKESLNAAYKERDSVKKTLEEKQRQEEEAEIARLEAEGKLKEAFEKRDQQREEENRKLREENTRLTRDTQVRNALSAYDFDSNRAMEMALKDISDEMILDDGKWVHKSKEELKDVLEKYFKQDDNKFLLRRKRSSGAPPASVKGDPDSQSNTSLFQRSQSEVLKGIENGTIRRKKRT